MTLCYSKATALILVWNLLLCFVLRFTLETRNFVYDGLKLEGRDKRITVQSVPLILIPLIFMPLSGWLADSRYGNFKVFKAGVFAMFAGSILGSVTILVLRNLNHNDKHIAFVISLLMGVGSNVIIFCGASASFTTGFQLGLDQMPDASSNDIISYIMWYFVTYCGGYWLSNVLFTVIPECTHADTYFISQVWGILPVSATCIILCIVFLFSKKWLIIEPHSPQVLKNVYKVLKFAWKHKAPLNRSAFTYWEEGIPSRLDLGKSKYGGPLKEEQVEEVKTLFRLLIVFVPVWLTIFSINLYSPQQLLDIPLELSELPNSTCVYSMFSKFTYNPWWCGMVSVFVYKTIVHRFLVYKAHISNSMTRLTICIVLVAIINVAFSTYSIVSTVLYRKQLSLWPEFVYSTLSSSILSLLFAFSMEFTCAQSPYTIRGLMTAYTMYTVTEQIVIGYLVSLIFTLTCESWQCSVAQYSVGAGFGVAGCLAQLLVTRCYRRREREQQYPLYAQVEGKFSKYLDRVQSRRTLANMETI